MHGTHKTVGISADLPHCPSNYGYQAKLSFNSLKEEHFLDIQHLCVLSGIAVNFLCVAAGVIKSMNSIVLLVP